MGWFYRIHMLKERHHPVQRVLESTVRGEAGSPDAAVCFYRSFYRVPMVGTWKEMDHEGLCGAEG